MAGLRKPYPPTAINYPEWDDLVDYLGGITTNAQIDATKILLAQGGSLLSTWRLAADLTKMDAAKVAGDIATAQMQTNVLAAVIAAGGIINANVNAAAGIAKSKISTTGAWTLPEHPTVPFASVRNSANLSIPTGTETTQTFDTEEKDTDGMVTLGTNNDRITIKTAGTYLVGATWAWDANATGSRATVIKINGTTNRITDHTIPHVSADNYTFHTLIRPYTFSVNDYIILRGTQTSGGNLNSMSFYNVSAPVFWAMWILTS